MYSTTCSMCQAELSIKESRRKRSKSGLFFCSKDCKTSALNLGRSGESRFAALVPAHYGTSSVQRNSKTEGASPLANQTCSHCGKTFARKHRAMTCSLECKSQLARGRALSRRNETAERWLNGEHELAQLLSFGLKGWARDYMLEEAGYACTKCCWSEISANGNVPLEIDHIDGNWKNSAYSNLRVLCPNCHALTPTYKVYNQGNNEQSRYAYFKERGWW